MADDISECSEKASALLYLAGRSLMAHTLALLLWDCPLSRRPSLPTLPRWFPSCLFAYGAENFLNCECDWTTCSWRAG